jgi:hypothetical protein
MRTRSKQIAVLCLLLMGVASLTYGLLFHSTSISPGQEQGSVIAVQSEPALIREVAVGGVRLDDSGQVKKTYTGQAPKACST